MVMQFLEKIGFGFCFGLGFFLAEWIARKLA